MLVALQAIGPTPAGVLGARLAVDKTTISRNLKVLLRNGWATVEQGADGREKLVSLSRRGSSKIEAARPGWDRAQERMRAALSAGTFEALRRQLSSVAAAALSA